MESAGPEAKDEQAPQPQDNSVEPVEPEQRPTLKVAASWVVPDIQLLSEECFRDFDLKSISHVVLQISRGRQEQVFAQIGVEYDWNFPTPFWFFLGKLLSEALFLDDSLLEFLNYVPVSNYEFIGYVNKDRVVDKDQKDSDQINVIDVHLNRPQTGQPIQIFWKPARGLVVTSIERLVAEQMSIPR
ncbi:hypothetical protein AK830_g2391 [Neonectria ditissima]|uniref:Uncharacterized protein n=1 Tax=Neonectria ditissima TaxID=78410 RepID=A0A0P7BS50_9HYPO|nr:hypothetical protein AK830_g2391 [Neonectria ditissima]